LPEYHLPNIDSKVYTEDEKEYIKKIKRLETKINFKLGSENSCFSYFDIQDGVLSICFEPLDAPEEEMVYSDQRIILFYGDSEREIVSLFNNRGLSFNL
jgi:hypothetical protein